MKNQIKRVISLLVFASVVAATVNARPRVAWFRPNSDTGFWPITERFMQAAAEDLEVDLDIYNFKGNPVLLVNLVRATLAMESEKPDALIFYNEKKRGQRILELSHQYKVPAFLFNSGFAPEEKVGLPRMNFPFWIGSMLPDDEFAGYLLAQELHRIAKSTLQTAKDQPMQIIALEGNHTSEASRLRTLGLKKYLRNNPDLILRQRFHSKWRSKLAYEAFLVSIERYPETKIFWTASDNMALAVNRAAKQEGWVPGKDYITGGIDLLPENQPHIIKGDLAVSVGGHYAEGAWSLIAVFDYLNGHDFAEKEGTQFKTKMFAYSNQLAQIQGNLEERFSPNAIRKLDFKKFSKYYNPDLSTYDFTLETLLNQKGK